MKQLTIILTATILLFSCKKATDDTIYTIKGVLYKDCSKTPMANTYIEFYDATVNGGAGVTSGPYSLGSDTTDANGNFEIKYKMQATFHLNTRLLVNNSAIMQNIPDAKNLDSVIVYQKATYNANINLNVTNPYTQNDTLLVNDLRPTPSSPNIKLTGPFSSGLLYNVSNRTILLPNYATSSFTDSLSVGYKIGFQNSKLQNTAICPCKTNEIAINIK